MTVTSRLRIHEHFTWTTREGAGTNVFECIEELHARILSRELAPQALVQRPGHGTAERDQIEIPGIEQIGSVLRVVR